jgi:hypothetical protein
VIEEKSIALRFFRKPKSTSQKFRRRSFFSEIHQSVSLRAKAIKGKWLVMATQAAA